MSGFRLLPEAEYELDDISLYVAARDSADIASRLIDTITERFWFLAQHPQIGRRRDHDLRPGPSQLHCRRVRHHLPNRGEDAQPRYCRAIGGLRAPPMLHHHGMSSLSGNYPPAPRFSGMLLPNVKRWKYGLWIRMKFMPSHKATTG